MYISVGQYADEQLEALNFLLNQQPFQHSSNSSQQKLQNSESNHVSEVVEIRPDFHREQRKGVPEVIYGETKDIEQIVEVTRKMLNETGRTIISRVPTEAIEVLRDVFNRYNVRVHGTARAVVIYKPDYEHRRTGGQVGVISAGTSDVPVAVIGLPTSVGYGVGGKGVAALLSMLQTCAPGLSVVNIDNGVGAGITAAMIANRVALARGHQSR